MGLSANGASLRGQGVWGTGPPGVQGTWGTGPLGSSLRMRVGPTCSSRPALGGRQTSAWVEVSEPSRGSPAAGASVIASKRWILWTLRQLSPIVAALCGGTAMAPSAASIRGLIFGALITVAGWAPGASLQFGRETNTESGEDAR